MAAFDPARLDDPDAIAAIDREDMLRALATAGAQVRRALGAAAEAGIGDLRPDDRPRGVLVAAMGADDLVADVVALFAEQGSPVAVRAAHNAPLPGWVGSLDLVVAVSLSGRARGPLLLAAEAARRGASLISVATADSPLADVTARGRGLHIPVDPAGITSRTATWSMLAPVLLALGRMGVVPVTAADLDAAADRLDTVAEASRPSAEGFVSPAKVLAADVADRLPLILGDGPLTGVVARRFGAMLARTARIPPMTGELPDDAAALLACLDGPYAARPAADGRRDIFADPERDGPATELALIGIRDVVGERPTAADAARHNLAQGLFDLARDGAGFVTEVVPQPGADLERLAELLALVDYTATYAAIGHGLDPCRSPYVERLRELTG